MRLRVSTRSRWILFTVAMALLVLACGLVAYDSIGWRRSLRALRSELSDGSMEAKLFDQHSFPMPFYYHLINESGVRERSKVHQMIFGYEIVWKEPYDGDFEEGFEEVYQFNLSLRDRIVPLRLRVYYLKGEAGKFLAWSCIGQRGDHSLKTQWDNEFRDGRGHVGTEASETGATQEMRE